MTIGSLDLFPTDASRAVFSPCQCYRYTLSRVWGDPHRRCLFIMLNPSVADAEQDDPTIRRCIAFSRAWGFGALDVGNIFAWRSTSPAALYTVDDPVGVANDEWLSFLVGRSSRIVVAWGNHGRHLNRGQTVLETLWALGRNPLCFRITKELQPEHPLYQLSDRVPVDARAALRRNSE